MSQDERYKQLALFSVIVAEVVITPAGCGALVYWLTRESSSRAGFALLGALGGLIVAFYRISLMMKRRDEHSTKGK